MLYFSTEAQSFILFLWQVIPYFVTSGKLFCRKFEWCLPSAQYVLSTNTTGVAPPPHNGRKGKGNFLKVVDNVVRTND